MLVPEIGLTPALEAQLRERFGDDAIAVLHSDMPEARRASHWLAAATGRARIVIGTRSAALVPMPALAAIVVDEEHDLSFKQQEGVRFSARDLAIGRAALAGIPVALGSATPSLESWHNAARGRYRAAAADGTPEPIADPRRPHSERHGPDSAGPDSAGIDSAGTDSAGADGSGSDKAAGDDTGSVHTITARIELVPLRERAQRHGLAENVIAAVTEALGRGEQSLFYLNRRGYSPVLVCPSCGWLSRCDHCDAYRVLHSTPVAGTAAGRALPARLPPLCERTPLATRLSRVRRAGPGADRARHPATRGRAARAVPVGADRAPRS